MGGGPAALTVAIYASRSGNSTLVLEAGRAEQDAAVGDAFVLDDRIGGELGEVGLGVGGGCQREVAIDEVFEIGHGITVDAPPGGESILEACRDA